MVRPLRKPRDIESETKKTRRTWNDMERTALGRMAWKDGAVDLCLQGAKS
jgi:hypothetical protein